MLQIFIYYNVALSKDRNISSDETKNWIKSLFFIKSVHDNIKIHRNKSKP